ncbi:MAG TPA: hypothetical protein VIF09_04750 [Polyangiaceae bacterium]|jgi:hypothetical protein
MRTVLASLFAASVLLAASVSRADDAAPAPARTDAPAPASTWYGYQTLATDGVALALLIPAATSGVSATQQGFGVGSLVMYGVAAPIVHFSHGHVGKGFLDLALRAGIPIATGFIGGAIAVAEPAPGCGTPSGCEPFGGAMQELAGIGLGVMIGVATAVTIDATVIAREPAQQDAAVDRPEPPPPPPRPTTATIAPTFDLAPERTGGTRATVGVVGTF